MLWEALVDTAEPSGLAKDGRLWQPGEVYQLRATPSRCSSTARRRRRPIDTRSRGAPPCGRCDLTEPGRKADRGCAAIMSCRSAPSWSPDGVRFRLWAPRAANGRVAAGRSGRPELADGARSRTAGSRSTTDGRAGQPATAMSSTARPFPIPASRYQPEGVHGAERGHRSRRLMTGAMPAGAAGRGTRLVIYELHLGTFSETRRLRRRYRASRSSRRARRHRGRADAGRRISRAPQLGI